ncbi:hypothetical protein J5N97_009462 [Dioscorea zingiberensis]|uniref:Uncharacterized protein n=1 Tax=Dioscorea zingiberensis TaxID=325984 RepID=A0A9D5CYT7_9LILI|nr:hypothetical protein J5N97_009462 [Dioscorea zingiberensis]
MLRLSSHVEQAPYPYLAPRSESMRMKRRVRSLRSTPTSLEMKTKMMRGDGVWRKTILMGEKCKPLDFSRAIYYDSEGRQLFEFSGKKSQNPVMATKPTTSGGVSAGCTPYTPARISELLSNHPLCRCANSM